ncbi:hypothetical protein D1970_02390 [Mesobacillus zeae]|uniref:Uncharacterized protein n=1 Tax=Mesobacillus zeae TaxID=1917180 RepID=A0A398BGA6_9BACI|nr:hypothetical protein D1970_02390 [Mesobacillus zeae]
MLATNYQAKRYKDKGVKVHDFSIVDITNPAKPKEISNWDQQRLAVLLMGTTHITMKTGHQGLHTFIAS